MIPQQETFTSAIIGDILGTVRVTEQRYQIDKERWYTHTVEYWTKAGWRNYIDDTPGLPDEVTVLGTRGDLKNKKLVVSRFVDMSNLYTMPEDEDSRD